MTSKAIRATIQLGSITLDVFQLPDGSYRMSQSQILQTIEIEPKRYTEIRDSKTAETFNLKGLELYRIKEESGVINNTISINDVPKVWRVCAKLKRGNQDKLDAIFDACLLEALETRADKAFNIKRSLEERNERMKARIEGKEVRLTFTDAIKAYIERNNITGNEAKFLYKNSTDKLYSFLTGYSSTKKFREKENIPHNHSPRDYASSLDLIHLTEIELAAARWIYKKNVHPYHAIEYVSNQLLLTHIGWHKTQKL